MDTLNPIQTTRPQIIAESRLLKPIGAGASGLYFAIPAGLTALSFYIFRPWLASQGYSDLTSYLAALIVPLALLFAAALIGYHRVEGHPLVRQTFAERMRFPRLRWLDAALGIGIAITAMLGYGLFSQVGAILIQKGILPLPTGLPALSNPTITLSLSVLNQAAGGIILGQWGIALLYGVLFFFNIAGEELWWRGYIFPRQELVFGRYTWIVHGLLWTCFHSFKYWDLIGLLPVCLLIAYAAQRLKNNWPGLIAHAIFNGIGLIAVLAAILGTMK